MTGAAAAVLVLGIAGAGLAASAGAHAEPLHPGAPKTLVIGVDGAAFDVMTSDAMPRVAALQAGGLTAASNLPASPMAPTVSGAGWSTIATGVWPDKHHVVDNTFTAPNYGQYPDYLSRIEQAAPDRQTLVVGTWGPISSTIFGAAVDERVQGSGDADTTAQTVERIATGDPDDVFVHLDEVDGAGHGSGASSQAYLEALAVADAQIGQILDAVQQRPGYADEDWLVVVTSDHGHTPTGGHGGATPLERKTFVIAQGAEFAPGSSRHDVRIADIAPTVLAHDGIARDATWDLDGLAVHDIVPDDFDTLRPALRPAVDETGPGELLGWTDQAPEGWSVDNANMPSGGSTEFRGWTFTTDDFFSNTERGQHRENNVRARDVFAVADSDEWDDVDPKSGRTFDSTLVSPAYPLNGAETAEISFVSDYAVDGPQGAAVWASFDEASGIPRQKLVDYPADGTRANPVNRRELLSLDLPRDSEGRLPQSLTLHFSYSGVNSAFWAIDQVAVAQPEAPAAPAVFDLDAAELVAGATVGVSGSGFAADEALAFELRSEPVALGGATADGTGAFGATVTIPADTPAGDHAFVVVRADGSELVRPISVSAATGGAVEASADAAAGGSAAAGTAAGSASGTAEGTGGGAAEGSAAGTAAGSAAAAAAGSASGGAADAAASARAAASSPELATTGGGSALGVGIAAAVLAVVGVGALLLRRRSA
ncbi:alkaline phosphatase family protein [Leucobacter allii]|uniref:alkaline phosphatase family protein n=1 Tax=Leucobacter allii TaxID=2932247 RepID=UPI001FD05580|nr:alkaline phosphatase family protein [Leucobacter allii]UOR01777.1 alkaline phosphatase family protein [Leucobacter allii]